LERILFIQCSPAPLEIAIFSQLLPFKNLYEYYTETDYIKTDAFQKTGSTLSKLLINITSLNLPESFLLEEDFLACLAKKAKINLDNLRKTKLLSNKFFAESGQFLQKIDVESLKEQDLATIYVDSTPINFLFDKKDFYLVDTESLGLFYKHHALSHNLVYFLLHFPFQQAARFRKNLIDTWVEKFVKHPIIDEKLLLENLKLQVAAYSTETLLYSYNKTQDKNLQKRPNRFKLHKEIVSYNLKLLSQLFPSYKAKSFPKTLKIFY
jgi:hypothetical protein